MARSTKQTGALRLRWAAREAWQIEVLQADPVVEFADEFLEALASENRADVSMGDGILTIRGVNRTVSLRAALEKIASHSMNQAAVWKLAREALGNAKDG